MIPKDVAVYYDLNDVTAFATYLSNHPTKQKIWWISAALDTGGLKAVIAEFLTRIEMAAGKLLMNHNRDEKITEFSTGTGGFMLRLRLDKKDRADKWVVHCEFFLVPSILFHGEYKTVENPGRIQNLVVDNIFWERVRNS